MTTIIPGHGIVLDGHDVTRDQAVTAASEHLAGVDDLVLADLLARPGLIVRAWWAGEDVGFVQPEHPDARPVTVVNVQALPSSS